MTLRSRVITGLDPVIQKHTKSLFAAQTRDGWIAGSSPAMTIFGLDLNASCVTGMCLPRSPAASTRARLEAVWYLEEYPEK